MHSEELRELSVEVESKCLKLLMDLPAVGELAVQCRSPRVRPAGELLSTLLDDIQASCWEEKEVAPSSSSLALTGNFPSPPSSLQSTYAWRGQHSMSLLPAGVASIEKTRFHQASARRTARQ